MESALSVLVGLTQLGFWAGAGAFFLLPAPGEPLSRPGGIQNLSGSQTVFRGALGAGKDGARGELKDGGGCRCLCLLCGSPSYKEGLLEAWAGPCPPVYLAHTFEIVPILDRLQIILIQVCHLFPGCNWIK